MTDENDVGEEHDHGEKSRKPRKRMKEIRKKILMQMEFYFSDSNLHKDRFLKKEVDKSEDGYIDISTFVKFNKIRQLTEDVKVIAKALKKSKLLQVNGEQQKVRRCIPLQSLGDVDDRTVYVEHLPRHIDHDWVRNLFSECGDVQYVSLPRFKSTGDLKRFGFVEFASKEEAERACEMLNNPPPMSGRIGKFPKWNKLLYQLKMKTGEEPAQEMETPEKPVEFADDSVQKPCKKHRKRKRHASDGSQDESADPLPVKKKRSESDVAEEDDKKEQDKSEESDALKSEECGKKENRKRKVDSENSGKKDSGEIFSDGLKSEEDDKKDGKRKKNKKKRLSDLSKSLEEDLEQTDSSAVEKVERGKRKRTSDSRESSELSAPQTKATKLESSFVTIESSSKKKRKRKKKNKEKDIPMPQLKVITKQEWLKLRQEYLTQQKANMTAMKQTLKQQAIDTEKKKKQEEAKRVEGDRPVIEFMPGVIVQVKCTKTMNRKTLKECLPNDVSVAYFDIKDDSVSGHIRCKDGDSAKKISDFILECYTFNLLTGDEETRYWDKLKADRDEKFSTKKRNKKRGNQKLIEKAHRHNAELMEKKKHIVFED